jgi:hypothetical protein
MLACAGKGKQFLVTQAVSAAYLQHVAALNAANTNSC